MNTNFKIYDVTFTFAETILLNALRKKRIIRTYEIIKQHSNIISKTSFARATKRLEELKIMKKTSNAVARIRHERIVEPEGLGIITLVFIDQNTIKLDILSSLNKNKLTKKDIY